jgi:hypothetical protein
MWLTSTKKTKLPLSIVKKMPYILQNAGKIVIVVTLDSNWNTDDADLADLGGFFPP